MQGSLFGQAERKDSPSTLIPDADNAAVGNAFAHPKEDPRIRDPPAFYFTGKEKRTEGERPEFWIYKCEGSRVPA